MAWYSVQPRDEIFVRDYDFLSFPKTLLDHIKQFTTNALKTVSERVMQKTADATGDLFDNKVANKIL